MLKTISWYYYRFRSMSMKEVFWRIKQILWAKYEKIFYKQWSVKYLLDADGTRLMEMFKSINFYGLEDIHSEDIPKDWTEKTLECAEKLLKHRYDLFALGDIDLGAEINWNYNYKRGSETPLIFSFDMGYQDSETHGDFKYLWELPRLQHLITLSKAFYLTQDERYVREVESQIKSFMKQCPYMVGINWIMPMEAAIRLISISWVVAFLKRYLQENKKTCVMIQQFISMHMDFVSNNYSAYSAGNNHLVAEAAGVFITSVCFNQLARASEYKQKSYEILCREIKRQFYDDGVNKEQTTHYQLSCSYCFLLAALVGQSNGISFPSEYWKVLEKSANFIMTISNMDGSVPDIGDRDDGKTVLLSETPCKAAQSFLAISAVLFDRSDFKYKARDFDEMSFWLFGKKGRAIFEVMTANSRSVRSLVAFGYGGYFVLNNNIGNSKLIFDCGPLGFESIAAHGHADALSFTFSAFDRDFFIDPGTYIYSCANPHRRYFRSTAAHNTVVIDYCDQAEFRGSFMWTKKYECHVEEWESNDHRDRIVAWHDGYLRLSDPVIHRRTVDWHKRDGVITLTDMVEARDSHTIQLCFHLAHECDLIQVEDFLWYISNRDKHIVLYLDKQLSTKIYRGSMAPICGWASRSYDQKSPIYTILLEGIFSGNQCFETKICLV